MQIKVSGLNRKAVIHHPTSQASWFEFNGLAWACSNHLFGIVCTFAGIQDTKSNQIEINL